MNLSKPLTIIALVLGLASAAHAADPKRNLAVAKTAATEQRIALVIGNSSYKDAPLANPVNDATDIANALRQAGFKVILKRNANTRDMRQAIREFGGELRRAQVGLFYFAGHGIQVKGANYLVPVGADIASEADTEDLAIDANYALRTMEEAQVKVSIVILDACRNNPYARSFRSAARGLAQMSAATGSVIAYATAPGSVAADGQGRNGVYTKHLLASLAQSNTDILKVFQRTRAEVVKETGGKQTPLGIDFARRRLLLQARRRRNRAGHGHDPGANAGANPRGGRAGVVERDQNQPRQARHRGLSQAIPQGPVRAAGATEA